MRRADRLSLSAAGRGAARKHGGGRSDAEGLPCRRRAGGAARRGHLAGRWRAADRRQRDRRNGAPDPVLETDLADRIIRVESGRTNLSVTGAVEDDGFFYAPDPSSQLACAIAGNIAMNSGGAHCLKYGVTTTT